MKEVVKKVLICDECGETKVEDAFCDLTSCEPHCKDCANGEWEMRGDDPCGKNWES